MTEHEPIANSSTHLQVSESASSEPLPSASTTPSDELTSASEPTTPSTQPPSASSSTANKAAPPSTSGPTAATTPTTATTSKTVITEPQSKPLLLTMSWMAVGVPFLTLFITLIVAPSYVAIFFSSAAGITTLLFAICWDLLGAFILFRACNKPISIGFVTTYMICIAVFVTPLLLISIFGPAVITIQQTFNEIVSGS